MSRRLAPVTLATILVAEWNSSKPANRRLKSFPYDLRDAIAEAIAEERAELEDRAQRAEETVQKLTEQLDQYTAPPCWCQLEAGDSPCPRHGENDE